MDPAAPLVGLLVHGGSFAFGGGVLEALDAVVDAWQPGVGGAAAIARALFTATSRPPVARRRPAWYAADAELPAAYSPTGPCPRLPCTFGAWALDLETGNSHQRIGQTGNLLRFRVRLSEYDNFGRIEPGRQGCFLV